MIKSLPSPEAYLNRTFLPLLLIKSSLALPVIVTFAPLLVIVSLSSVPSINVALMVLLMLRAVGVESLGFMTMVPSGRSVSPTVLSATSIL